MNALLLFPREVVHLILANLLHCEVAHLSICAKEARNICLTYPPYRTCVAFFQQQILRTIDAGYTEFEDIFEDVCTYAAFTGNMTVLQYLQTKIDKLKNKKIKYIIFELICGAAIKGRHLDAIQWCLDYPIFDTYENVDIHLRVICLSSILEFMKILLPMLSKNT
jgi:hypothetical protein